MNAVIYCRVSSKKQELEGHGAESQEFSCRQYAEIKGWKVLKVFTDKAYSGALEDRPQANEMLVYLLDHPNTVVLMDDISRQARDREIYYSLKTKIQKLDCQPKFVNLEIPDNEDGDFFELVSVGLAEWMRKKNRSQVLKRMQARLGGGYWCFYPPRGYQFGEDKTLVFKEPEATSLKEVLENFAEGYIVTQAEAVKILNDKGFKTSRTKIKDILADPIYCGRIEYPKWDILVEKGRHPALISTETHLKILEKFNQKPATKKDTDISSQFILKGILSCSQCKSPMRAYITTKTNKSGKKSEYPKYDCRNKTCKVSYSSVPKDVVENQITEILSQIHPNKTLIQLFELTLEQVIKDYGSQVESIREDVQKSITKKESEIERVVKRIAGTQRDSVAEALELELDKLYKEKLVLETKLKITGNKEDQEKSCTAVFEISEFLKNLDKNWIKSDVKMKRLMLDFIFDNQIVFDQNSRSCTAKKSYLMRLFDHVTQENSNGGLVGSKVAPLNILEIIQNLSRYSDILKFWSIDKTPIKAFTRSL